MNPKKQILLEKSYMEGIRSTEKIDIDDELNDEKEVIKSVGIEMLKERRLIPLGRLINDGRPYFMRYPKLTDTSYNVFAFVSPMGGGKTGGENEYLYTKEYNVITWKEAYGLWHKRQKIHVLSAMNNNKPIWSPITDAMFSGEKNVLQVITEGGSRCRFSKDHIVLIWDGGIKNKRAHELTTDDWVLFPKKIDYPEWSDKEKEEHARMCGIFIADGNCNKNNLYLSNNKYREFILKYFAKHTLYYREYYRNNCYKYNMCGSNMRKFKKLIGIDQEYCVAGNKKIPSWIFQNKAYMRAFIQGLMECDGSFTTGKQGKDRKGRQKPGKRHRIELIMKSRQVINAVCMMLLGFGIRANYRTKMARATNTDMEYQEYYGITIQGNDNLKRYLDKIPPYTDFQKDRIKDWNIEPAHNSNMRYQLDAWMDKVSPILEELKIKGQYWDYLKKKQKPADNHRFRELLAKLDAAGYQDVADEVRWLIDNYYMVKIKSIEPAGKEICYDFEVQAANFLAGDGCGFFVHNSTNVRNQIYFQHKLEPDCITIIFDPMKMEFSKLSVKQDTPEKRAFLLNDAMLDPETNNNINVSIEPDKLSVFHIIPRFALNRATWNQEELGYQPGWDKTTLKILQKDGGFIFAEDASRMSEEQIFHALNYHETRTDQAVHYYLRAAVRICNNKHGQSNWFIQDLIRVLRDSVKRFRDVEEMDNVNLWEIEANNDKTNLSSTELGLIEQLEKYKDAGFFITNIEERKKYTIDFRKFIKLGKILNISFLGYKKTDKIGEDIVRGQSDLILERIIEISNEYYDGIRKIEQDLPTSAWEDYLMKKWKVSLWFEESEIFIPRDVAQPNIKKVPTIKRIEYLMSFGRKYGIKNFGFVTQRITKCHPIVFKEASHLFLGPIIGKERDQILSDFGVDKVKFPMRDSKGREQIVAIRDIVTTLSKDKHEWLFIDKGRKTIAAIRTFDAPVG